MIKGAFIFAAGVGVGYSVAMGNQEPNGEVKKATAEFVRTMKGVIADAHLDAKNETRDAFVKDSPYCPFCGAAEEADGHGKAHADDCPTLEQNKTTGDIPSPDAVPQGETPS